jgi:hypothetical protein
MPVSGKGSLLELIFQKFYKPEVPTSAIELHNLKVREANRLAQAAEAIDKDKFTQREFIEFLKVRYFFTQETEGYENLWNPLQLLEVAIGAKNSYICIDQIEMCHRSIKQQEFYNFVEKLLNPLDRSTFKQEVHNKLEEVLPHVKTEEGKGALQRYIQELDKLAKHELGLKLLSLFKLYQLADYSTLRIISDLVESLKRENLLEFKGLMVLVVANLSIFEKLRPIISIPQQRSTVENYAKMLHYLGLANRHQKSFSQFQEMLQIMRQWNSPYHTILAIHKQYPCQDYKHPPEFKQVIEGEELYFKYKRSLTDQKTGHTYVDFGERTPT